MRRTSLFLDDNTRNFRVKKNQTKPNQPYSSNAYEFGGVISEFYFT